MYNEITHEITPLRLWMTILNLDLHSPVLFLNVSVNKENRLITGTCDFSILKAQKSKSFKTEIKGEYRIINTLQEGDQLMINLLGYPHYDQNNPSIKITLLVNPNWKRGKAYYQYLEDGNWVHVRKSEIKIKGDEPYYATTNDLNIPYPDFTFHKRGFMQ